jgi:hypothetical protein
MSVPTRQLGVIGFVTCLVIALASVGFAGSTERWVVDEASDLLAGRGDGVAVTADGRLVPAPHWSGGPTLDEPIVLAAARQADGSLLAATSHPGVLYRVTGDRAERLAEIPGERVTAMVVDGGGHPVLAAGTPSVVYRWRKGELEEIGRLDEGGVWDLALFDGRVVAAAGAPGALYVVGERGLERWVEVPDRHARCLEVAGDRLMVGTSGRGLLLSVDAAGRLALVTSSAFSEITDLVATPDGAVWVAALVGEPPSSAKDNGNGGATSNGDGSDATETAVVSLDLPKVNGKTATSEVLRLTPEGALLGVHRFTSQVASALAFDGEGVLAGTGYEGEVWRFVDSGGALVATLDAVQVVGIVDGGRALLTQGPAAVRWRDADGDRPNRFRSAPKAFDTPVRFGAYRLWPASSGASIRFRTGTSADAEATWLPWTEWSAEAEGAVPLAPGRVVQWEVELGSDAADPDLDRVELAYRQVNLAPRIKGVTVDEPGAVYLNAPPPSGPVLDADAPDASGIFTVVDEKAQQPSPNGKGKKYYRVGYRTVAWDVDDPNGDELRYTLSLERDDGFRFPVRERLEGTQVAVDMGAVPDGTYRFVVAADDGPANPGEGRRTERSSAWLEVDSTPPSIDIRREGDGWAVTVRDTGSGVARVAWSRDGDRWREAAPQDGLLDGREERFLLPVGDGDRHLLVVRALDRHHNRATASVVDD